MKKILARLFLAFLILAPWVYVTVDVLSTNATGPETNYPYGTSNASGEQILCGQPQNAVAQNNDLVLCSNSLNATAPAGPQIAGLVLRARPGSVPGTCRLVVAAGNTFGQEITILDKIPAGSVGC